MLDCGATPSNTTTWGGRATQHGEKSGASGRDTGGPTVLDRSIPPYNTVRAISR